MEGIPLVILGGADRRPVDLPRGTTDVHPLATYKAVAVRIDGRPLIEVLLDAIESTRAFGPVYLAGPARVYGEVRDSVLRIDTDASFGANIRVAVETVRREHPGRPVAFLTCDVTLSAQSIKTLVSRYREDAPCDLWFPLVRSPQRSDRLGASSWKPRYRLAPSTGAAPVAVLPGHLVIADTDALRLGFLFRLLDLAYGSRNRSIHTRRGILVMGVLGTLVWHDVLHVASFRVPNLTWSVLRSGLSGATRLERGRLTISGLEDAIRAVLVKHAHQARFPDRRVRTPLVDELDLAMDIDTEEEVAEHGGRITPVDPGTTEQP